MKEITLEQEQIRTEFYYTLINDNTTDNFDKFKSNLCWPVDCFKRNMGWPIEAIPTIQGQSYGMFVHQTNPKMWKKKKLIKLNDTIGDKDREAMHQYTFGMYNPLTIRYLKVHSDIDLVIGDMSDMNVVEIGGGYGGQMVVSSLLSGFRSWTQIDKPRTLLLQMKYIAAFNEKYPDKAIDNVHYVNYLNYKDKVQDRIDLDKIDLVISCHCFDFCLTREQQEDYMENLLQKSKYGYMMNIHHTGPHLKSSKYTVEEYGDALGNVKVQPDVVALSHKKMIYSSVRNKRYLNDTYRSDYVLTWENEL